MKAGKTKASIFSLRLYAFAPTKELYSKYWEDVHLAYISNIGALRPPQDQRQWDDVSWVDLICL